MDSRPIPPTTDGPAELPGMRRRTRILLLWTCVLTTLVLVGVIFMIWLGNAYATDGSRAIDGNRTAADAIAEGTFLQHVDVSPDTLRTAWGALSLGRGWIHEDSHLRFRWLVQRRLVREGTYRLCFTAAPEPAGEDPLRRDRSRWLADAETGARYESTGGTDALWRYCRPVARPFPARVSVALVEEDSLRARMHRLVGAVYPPLPAAARLISEVPVQSGRREMRLARVEWNALPMLWISEREGGPDGTERWRVRRVMDHPEVPTDHELRFGPCSGPGERSIPTLVLQAGGDRQISSAWRVSASADLEPIPVAGLACGYTRPL